MPRDALQYVRFGQPRLGGVKPSGRGVGAEGPRVGVDFFPIFLPSLLHLFKLDAETGLLYLALYCFFRVQVELIFLGGDTHQLGHIPIYRG